MMRRALLCWGVLNWVWASAWGQASWTYEKPFVWARDENAITLEKREDRLIVRHTGRQDWCLSGFQRIPVKPGDIIELNCRVKAVSSTPGVGVSTGVILRDGEGREVSWVYGGTQVMTPCDWTELTSRFIPPANVVSIEPRITGFQSVTAEVQRYVATRVGSLGERIKSGANGTTQLENGRLRFNVDGAAARLSVTDLRTGRVWSQAGGTANWMVLDTKVSDDKRSLALTLLDPETVREFKAVFTLEEQGAELSVAVTMDGAMQRPLNFPLPFATRKGDRLIVPMNEGVGYPVHEEHQGLHRMIAYGGHGICMGFFGVADDATGAGWMCILKTPDDAAMDARKGADGMWVAGPSWDAQRGQFGYTRKARYVFFEAGGHVAMCKRYRAHARQAGLLVPFSEKVKRIPNIDRLIGAANIWRMGKGAGDPVALVKEMQALGMRRLLWSASGSPEQIKALRELPDVLVGRYDIYQDIMDPAHHERVGYKHGDWVTEAFPHDINWAGPSAAQWRRGWRVKAKDGEMIPCAVICDSKALPYARARIAKDLQAKPFTARFIDTTVAAPWFECYHPDHPMTRTQSRQHKMALLKLIGEFGLVCGSETGHEASVPFCDYFEGMLSIGPYRVPDSGRNMLQVWDEVPENLAKYQVGEAYRLPLWELVYHDCAVAQWYWGDYNNKLPKVWRKRDLFNALYGTPPMYLFDGAQWEAKKAQFAASYQVATPVARATGYHEMTDHQILTPDRTVQRTVFANGVTVTVNFGQRPYRLPDGSEIPALDVRVTP
ncbi:MAG TPA: glycoside hydrolase [Kiritimatiellia bacterium]|nr:glycoside hydrolase [Kiritimatiellia bacterium]